MGEDSDLHVHVHVHVQVSVDNPIGEAFCCPPSCSGSSMDARWMSVGWVGNKPV